jgi:hypothetical protein
VQTTLNFLKENEDGSPPAPAFVGKPETYDRPAVTLPVTIHDVSGHELEYTLDKNGFQFYYHESKEKDFVDDEKIKAEYYPEVEQLLKDAYVHKTHPQRNILTERPAPAHPKSSSSTTQSAANRKTNAVSPPSSEVPSSASTSTSPTPQAKTVSPTTSPTKPPSSSRADTRSSTSGGRSELSSRIH